MAEALGNVLPLAVAIAIFPVPIIAVVLLLGSRRGRAKATAFVLAWLFGLAAVGAATLLLAEGADADDDGAPATWVSVVLLCLGLLLLVAAVAQWRGRPGAGEEAPIPGWMRAIDGFGVPRAGGAGLVLSGLNPKNVLLAVAAALEIGELGLPAGEQAVTLLVFVVLASVGVLAPLVLTLALGERACAPLDRLRGWMARHNAVIMAVLSLLIGAKLIGDGIGGFSG